MIEQGGSLTLNNGNNTTVTLLQKYEGMSYTALFTRNELSNNNNETVVSFVTNISCLVNKTKTSITISDPGFNVSRDVSWFACGY